MADRERPVVTAADAERVRKRLARVGRKALEHLQAELAGMRLDRNSLPESWARNFKIVADQLRRDYRLDGDAEAETPEAPADPLAGLKVVAPPPKPKSKRA